jgi:hypothetical protein
VKHFQMKKYAKRILANWLIDILHIIEKIERTKMGLVGLYILNDYVKYERRV